MPEKFDYYEKRMSMYGGDVELLGFGVYPFHSVLAGRERKVFLLSAPSESELEAAARAAGHDVDVEALNWYHPMLHPDPDPGPIPPPGFDPSYAGERWDDDY